MATGCVEEKIKQVCIYKQKTNLFPTLLHSLIIYKLEKKIKELENKQLQT